LNHNTLLHLFSNHYNLTKLERNYLMKRSFWSMLLLVMTVSGGWAIYVGAQDFQSLLTETSMSEGRDELRYQFIDHFFLQSGRQFEVLLRLDRITGETHRFHASQGVWTAVGEPSESPRPIASGESRYDMISHVYRDQAGIQHELIVRVDYIDGASWSYKGMSGSWTAIAIEQGQDADQAVAEEASVVSEAS
jgi:hypothetical protein